MFEGFKVLFSEKKVEEQASAPSPDSWGTGNYDHIPGGSNAGVYVSSDTALSTSTIMSIVRGISSPVAMMPRTLEQKKGNKSTEVKYHELAYLISSEPNPFQTSYHYHEMIMMNLLLWGNHYSLPIYDNRGTLQQLFPLQPAYVQPYATDASFGTLRIDQLIPGGDIIYRWLHPTQGMQIIHRSEIFHVKGLTKNAIFGINPIEYARDDIGLSLAGRMAASLSFSQGINPSGILETPLELTVKAYDRLKKAAQETNAGLQNVGHPFILEQGMKWNWNTLDNVKLQSLESRKFQKIELCSMFNYPPYKVGEMERANFANNEQQDTEFLYNCLLSWITRIDLSENFQLLSRKDRDQGLYIRTHYQDFLKGDSAARSNYNQKAITTGWITPNEARISEGMDISDDPEANKLHFPLNLSTEKQPPAGPEVPAAADGKDMKNA